MIPAQITREIFAHIAHKFDQGRAVADEAILDWNFFTLIVLIVDLR
jgi:predicted DNA-binding protein (UPF0278 family)